MKNNSKRIRKLLHDNQFLDVTDPFENHYKIQILKTMRERMIGLISHKSLDRDQSVLIDRCSSIHCFFMKFSIDAIFLDKSLKITKIVRNISPWTPFIFSLKGYYVIETQCNLFDQRLGPGDQLVLKTIN